MLTDAAIKRLRASDKDRVVSDADGLYVKVYTSGAKKFMVRRMTAGKTQWTTIGSYPEMSLAEARAKALAPSPNSITVGDAAEAWLAHVAKTYRSSEQVVWRMNKHVLPKFSALRLRLLTRAGISSHLLSLSEHNGPVIANRCLGDIKQFMLYCVHRGWLEESPVAILSKKVVGGKEKSRNRVLDDDELTRLIHLLLNPGRLQPKSRLALALLLATGQRSGEVRGLHKSEVYESLWTIPAYRTKNGIASRVSLTHLTKYLVEKALLLQVPEPFTGMDGQTLARIPARLKLGWTPHDLRRTMATHMAEMGVMPHIIEKCLNHKMGGVMEIYNRAEYAEEKKAAWRKWQLKLLRLRKKEAPG